MATKRSRADLDPTDEVQRGNRSWWSDNPMTYDWHGDVDLTPRTRPWFDEIDRRFIDASRPYLTDRRAFDRVMPDDLQGRRVLEIGCGMGLHSLELARRGAEVHAVDITDTAVRATQARMAEYGVEADIRQADAESLPFDDSTFDLVWSWGVIHHSARTTRIVREIARVLAPDGQTRVMVYNRDGTSARFILLRHHVIGGGFLRNSPDETLWRWTDGYCARFYHREQVEDLFRGFFQQVSSVVLGQDVDVVPLPRRIRSLAATRMSDARKLAVASRRGSFLFVTASGPE